VANSEEIPVADRCSAARHAIELSERGLSNSPSGDTLTGLNSTRVHALAVLDHLSNCGDR
jgi:hypothetical protein